MLVLYDFMGKRDTDLGSLSKGETISVLVEQETGWWLREAVRDRHVPSNYVKKIDAKPPPPPPPPPPLGTPAHGVVYCCSPTCRFVLVLVLVLVLGSSRRSSICCCCCCC